MKKNNLATTRQSSKVESLSPDYLGDTTNQSLLNNMLVNISESDALMWRSNISANLTTPSSSNYSPNELIVQFSSGIGLSQRAELLRDIGGIINEIIHGPDRELHNSNHATLARVTIPTGLEPQKVIELLSHRPGIDFVELNYIVSIDSIANDPYYSGNNLWGMYGNSTSPTNQYGSQAGEAWVLNYTGSRKVVTGVIDSGIDYTHPDLYLNVWLNQGEIPTALKSVLKDVDSDGLITFYDLNQTANQLYVSDKNGNGRIDAGDLLSDINWENGINEDGNSYFDDLIGWDFANNDNDPYDDNNHGTHVSGTIGGIGGNGVGVVGVNWTTQIMGLKFLSSSGSGSTSNAVSALNYYTAMSTSIANSNAIFWGTNNSWGGGGFSQAMLNAIGATAMAGNLFVAAAGNASSNNDAVVNYPSNYTTVGWNSLTWDAVIAVASLTSSGVLSSFSNYGNTTVDLAAPGSGIISTVSGGGYANYSGTSMATPHVAGALALLSSVLPNATPIQLINLLKNNVALMSSLAASISWDGRLDIGALMTAAKNLTSIVDMAPPTVVITIDDSNLTIGETSTVTFTFSEVVQGFTKDDILISSGGGSLSSLSTADGGKTWKSVLTPSSTTTGYQGSYTLSVTDQSYTDLSSNLGSAASTAYSISMGVMKYGALVSGVDTSEQITGTVYNDKLSGVAQTGTSIGRKTIDTLIGNGGSDIFILSDTRGIFYDDGVKSSNGSLDYAYIKDFVNSTSTPLERDYLQFSATLSGKILTKALTMTIGGNSISGVGVYYDVGRTKGIWDSTDELVAFVGGVASIKTTTGGDCLFV